MGWKMAHLELKANVGAALRGRPDRQVTVAMTDFAFPYADLIPEDIRSKIRKWSDYIDYWAVGWNFQNDTFMNGWVA